MEKEPAELTNQSPSNQKQYNIYPLKFSILFRRSNSERERMDGNLQSLHEYFFNYTGDQITMGR